MSGRETLVAVLATLVGLAAIVADQVAGDTDTAAAGLAGAVTVGMAVLVFGGAVPVARARPSARAAETALATSIIAFLSVASAWRGLPFVLGTGGAMLARATGQAGDGTPQRGLAVIALCLAAFALVLGTVAVAVQ
jgi:hypothetical protein